MDAIYGVTMALLAEITSKHGELRAQFGEQQGMAEFERWLASKGLDQSTYANAHNAWLERFRADPTGRSEASFHMLLQQHTQRAHFGDVRDMSQDTEEGVTLDTYAQITVGVGKPGANAEEIVRQHGLTDMAHWQRANAAWAKKMGEDTTHKLSMQYGQLYQRYSGPSFTEKMTEHVAAALAEANKPRDVVDERDAKEELTPELCFRKIQSPERKIRWRFAYHLAHMADLGNVPDKAAAIAAVTPILLEKIESHDEFTTSDAESGARKLWEFGNRSDDFRGAVSRCLNRAEDKLRSLEAAFAPIQNQAVPERIMLQSKIQDYRSLVETMRNYKNETWTPVVSAAAPAIASAGGPIPFPAAAAMPRAGGGFPKWLIAPAVLLTVGGIFFATKGRQMMADRTANAATAGAAAATPDAPPSANAAAPTASSAAAPAKTAAPKAKAAAPKKGH